MYVIWIHHFDIQHQRKLKVINNKIAVSGQLSLNLKECQYLLQFLLVFILNHSDIQVYYTFVGLGFYKVINDNWDTRVESDLYSYGWRADVTDYYLSDIS